MAFLCRAGASRLPRKAGCSRPTAYFAKQARITDEPETTRPSDECSLRPGNTVGARQWTSNRATAGLVPKRNGFVLRRAGASRLPRKAGYSRPTAYFAKRARFTNEPEITGSSDECSLRPGNTVGARRWTSNKVTAGLVPERNGFVLRRAGASRLPRKAGYSRPTAYFAKRARFIGVAPE